MEQDKRDVIVSCLEKVLKSPEFAASERLCDFLRFIVGETLAGRGDRLKAYSIAIGAFKFEDSFDPQENSIVRVEASRLRKRLSDYYAAAGVGDPLEIRVLKGSYTPEFVQRYRPTPAPATVAPSNTAGPAGLHAPSSDWPPDSSLRKAKSPTGWLSPAATLAAGIAAGIAGCLALAAAWLWLPDTQASAPAALHALDLAPSLAIAKLEALPESGLGEAEAQSMTRELQSAFAHFQTIRLFEQDPAAVTNAPPEYRLLGVIARKDEALQLTFRLIHTADSRVIWTGSFDTRSTALDESARAGIAALLTATLARGYGVIVSDRFLRMPGMSDATRGFSCTVHGFKYFETPSEPGFRAARKCLEATIADNPKDSRAYSMLAALGADGYVNGMEDSQGRQTLTRAAEQARRAITLAPQSAQAHLALFMARFADKHYEDAFETGAIARALNPYSAEIGYRLGSAYIVRGESEKGMALLQGATGNGEIGPSWLSFYLFLNAYMHDDDAAARIAQRTHIGHTPLGILAKLIVQHRRGENDEVHRLRLQLGREFPAFAADIEAALTRLGLVESIRNRLLDDLRRAGVVTAGDL